MAINQRPSGRPVGPTMNQIPKANLPLRLPLPLLDDIKFLAVKLNMSRAKLVELILIEKFYQTFSVAAPPKEDLPSQQKHGK